MTNRLEDLSTFASILLNGNEFFVCQNVATHVGSSGTIEEVGINFK